MGDWRLMDWGRKLQALAQSGLAYDPPVYDRLRYEEVRRIGLEMITVDTGETVESLAAGFAGEVGQATPKLDVRGAVFLNGELLLVREAATGLWTLPGGWGEIGQSAGEAAAREVREESGYVVQPVKLIALHDREQRGYPPHPWYTHKATFLCELTAADRGEADHEVTEVGFFEQDELPPLDLARTARELVDTCFAHQRDPALPTEFD
jgi:ADP-ribose pyrophosphatase YjhB (NUDIX family)